MASVNASVQMHNHKAQVTDSAVKQHIFDKGFCPEHPDIKIRKKNLFRSDTVIPCPECASNRALDRRKKEMEINHHSKEAAAVPVATKVSSVESVFRMDGLKAEVLVVYNW